MNSNFEGDLLPIFGAFNDHVLNKNGKCKGEEFAVAADFNKNHSNCNRESLLYLVRMTILLKSLKIENV